MLREIADIAREIVLQFCIDFSNRICYNPQPVSDMRRQMHCLTSQKLR